MIRKNFYIKQKRIKEKSGIRYIPSTFIAIILIAFGMSGFTANVANYILIGILFSWYLFALVFDPSNFTKMVINKITLAYLAFVLFFFLTCFYSSGIENTAKLLGEFFILFSYYFVYLYYHQLQNKKYLTIIFKMTIFSWTIFTFIALIFYQINENAARMLASDSSVFDDIAIGGGYGLAYGSAILCVYLFDCVLNKRITKIKHKVIAVISCILLYLLVFETRSTVTILITTLGIVLCLAFYIFNRIGKNTDIVVRSIVSTFLIVLGVIVIVSNLNFIGESMMKATVGKKDIVSVRIFEVGSLIIGQSEYGQEEDVAVRNEHLRQSFNTFKGSPFFGVGYKYGYYFGSSNLFGVGNHSEWVDSMAKYGLFGGVPYLLMFIFALSEIRKRNKREISSAFIFVVFLLGFLNPFITSQSIIALFFILNAAESYFSERKGELIDGQVEKD